MTLEDKMNRNIKQIEDAGMCPLDYFLDKTTEECLEVIEAINEMRNMAEFDPIAKFVNLQSERADLKNCLGYLDILCEDKEIVAGIQPVKVDRGYEKGVK